MPNEAVQQLLEQAQRSGLFSAAVAQNAVAHMTADEPRTADEAVRQMVARKLLTPYQAEQLLEGRGEECVIAGRYRILEKLGEGGMGTVFKAHDSQLDRDVAVKALPTERLHDADAVARFQREARALARLSHPNIIQAYDSGVDRGRSFVVMEYLPGASLAAVLREQGAVPPTLAADVVYQAVLGLAHAHQKGLVHRDIKPANLMLSRAGDPSRLSPSPLPLSPEGRGVGGEATAAYIASSVLPALGKGVVKILDLGLARFLQDQIGDAQLTREGTGVGTPDYMAPEQFRDALHADARTDIYGLGCTLYHLIGGAVPFPTSSFSEKADAHAKKEPIPLEERCPEVPAGLAMVVAKMMAKHPADRFQTAGEVAEALAPYVAGASHSMILLRQTMRFHAGQLTVRAPRRRRRFVVGGAAILAVACISGTLVLAWPGLFRRDAEPQVNVTPAQNAVSGAIKPEVAAPEPSTPKVITIANGLTVAKDGTGQFQSITEALAKVEPGMTIRVLDDAVYDEALVIREHQRHTGIIVESPRRATLALPKSVNVGVLIVTPRVTVRGFRVRLDHDGKFAVGVGGASQGVVLEDLEFQSPKDQSTAITVEGLTRNAGDAPVTIRNCSIDGFSHGIQVLGKMLKGGQPYPVRGVLIYGNTIRNARNGIPVSGSVRDLVIAGNRFIGCTDTGVYFEDLFADCDNLLVVNNTFQSPRYSVQLMPPMAVLKNVRVENNLILAGRGLDFANLTRNPKAAAGWRIRNNWRQLKPPEPSDAEYDAWMQSPEDKVVAEVPLLSSDSKHKDFLRPARALPFTTPRSDDLPNYIGAVPAEQAAPWDWRWTWDAAIEGRLTVSKDPQARGRFRTIGAALRAAKPQMTIRVLDAEKYAETLVVDDAKSHQGLTLDAPQHATLALADGTAQGLLVQGVANVRVRGLRMEASGSTFAPFTNLVRVTGTCPGLILEDLECQGPLQVGGFELLNPVVPEGAEPIVIRNCRIATRGSAVMLSGSPDSPIARVMVVHNHIQGCINGINVEGTAHDVLIAGNRVLNCGQAGLQVMDPDDRTQRVLVANNTVYGSQSAIRMWRNGKDDVFAKGQVEFRGNVLLGSLFGDMMYYRQEPGKSSGTLRESQMLLELWRFGENYRDLAGSGAAQATPLAKDDRKLDAAWLMSRSASDADFLRPRADSPLAKGGAGGDLPPYAGAVPPSGVAAWDWEKTWKARTDNRAPKNKANRDKPAG